MKKSTARAIRLARHWQKRLNAAKTLVERDIAAQQLAVHVEAIRNRLEKSIQIV